MAQEKLEQILNAMSKRWGEDLEEIKEYVKDLLTLTIVTKVKKNNVEEEVARTSFFLDGDIECLIPLKGETINREILEFHQRMVETAMSNRTEIVKAILGLLKLIPL